MKTDVLPPGQRAIDDFPRFGLRAFATRFPTKLDAPELTIAGDVARPFTLGSELRELPRMQQTSDFHCVTTWTKRGLRWSGYRFATVFERLIQERARPDPDARFVVFRSQDGYRVSLPLDDLLAADVCLADTLEGSPLTIAHGAPLRLIAPAHYGYKNPKHLRSIEFWKDDQGYRPSGLKFMDHPRGRVALEERGRGLPGCFYRPLYRALIPSTVRLFRRALEAHEAAGNDAGNGAGHDPGHDDANSR